MVQCAVKWCGKGSTTSNYAKDGIGFHKFPNDTYHRNIWINATRRGDDFTPKKSSVICSRHFKADCFITLGGNMRRLFPSAVPTLFLPFLTNDDGELPRLAIKQLLEPGDANADCRSAQEPQSCTASNPGDTKKGEKKNGTLLKRNMSSSSIQGHNINKQSRGHSIEPESCFFGRVVTSRSTEKCQNATPGIANQQENNSNSDMDMTQVENDVSIPFAQRLLYSDKSWRERRMQRTIDHLQYALSNKAKLVKRLQDKNRKLNKKVENLEDILKTVYQLMK